MSVALVQMQMHTACPLHINHNLVRKILHNLIANYHAVSGMGPFISQRMFCALQTSMMRRQR